MTNTIAPAALTEIFKKHGSDSLVKDILAEIDRASAVEKKGSNVETRKAAHRKALKEANAVEIAKVNEAQELMLPLGTELAQASDEVMVNGLTDEQAKTAMQSYLAGKLVAETQTAIQELVKTLVFRSMDLAAEEMGEEFPEMTNMTIDVPETGKRFCREGAGRKDAEIDFDALMAAVGPEVFAQITTQKVEITHEINDSALRLAILEHPELMEQVRDAVVPGSWKSPRLMVRDIPANEKE